MSVGSSTLPPLRTPLMIAAVICASRCFWFLTLTSALCASVMSTLGRIRPPSADGRRCLPPKQQQQQQKRKNKKMGGSELALLARGTCDRATFATGGMLP